ncbi:hypothetical protein CN340_19540 [Bacillus anthracis]|nr:hypothetical protein CN340_19540 [Bacillus anthracis]
MWVSSRVTAVVPSTPEIHVPAVHTASSDVGIELPATWQHYQIPGQITPSFWHHGAHPSSTLFQSHAYPPLPQSQIFYHFPSIYFQNFYGTFNI